MFKRLLVGLLVLLAAIGPTTARAAVVGPADGTWVLLQVSDIAQLNSQAAAIGAALDNFDVRGLSLRVPWNTISYSLLDAGKALADASGKAFSFRFMAGRFTPEVVFSAGSPYYVVSGQKVPVPFRTDGSPNYVFEWFYWQAVAYYSQYARSRGVTLLHLPWYGHFWAELNNGAEVRAQPGYSEQTLINAHIRLFNLALRYAYGGLAIEYPMSGYGPLVRVAGALTDSIVAKIGPYSGRMYVQANGLGSASGDWGAPTPTVEQQMDAAVFAKAVLRGEQMVQPTDFDWAAVYDGLVANGASYVEVYLASFSGAAAGQLATEITSFANLG